VLGALATATAFLVLSGHPLREGSPAASPDDDVADVDVPGTLDPAEHKTLRAVGDRRITRDRLGDDIGAERAERARPGAHTGR
jgi:hypothetical protein